MSRPTILVVDDEQYIVDILSAILQLDGYGVLKARNGDEALLLARERLPSLILTDYMMPGLDGIQLVRQLGASAATASIPVILMSCVTRDMSDSGAVHFLPKPFDLDVVLRLAERYTKGSPREPLDSGQRARRSTKPRRARQIPGQTPTRLGATDARPS